MILVDSHAHIFKEDYTDLEVEEVFKNRDILVNIVAFDLESSYESVSLSNKYEYAFSTCGFHPYDINKLTEESFKNLETLFQNDKVIAVGEIGLDYFRDLTSKTDQQKGFERQIELAKKINLPVVIHSRNSFFDTLSILDNVKYFKGVFHSFDYGLDEARAVLDRGFFVSFSGMITFNKRSDLREVAKYVPLDRVLFETDSPYLTPVPLRGRKNKPHNVELVYEFFANLRAVETELLNQAVCNNFFNIFDKAKLTMGKEVVCSKF